MPYMLYIRYTNKKEMVHMTTIEKYTEQAETLKKQGAYAEALETYVKAIQLDSSNSRLYRAFGKVAYLMQDQKLAVAAYLSALHIEIAKIEYYGLTEETEKMLVALPDEMKEALPKVGGFIIYYDTNTLRHLAHAVADFDEEAIRKQPKMLAYKEIYAAELTEDDALYEETLKQFNRTEDEVTNEAKAFYIPVGKELAFSWIKWNELNSLDVGKLYFP